MSPKAYLSRPVVLSTFGQDIEALDKASSRQMKPDNFITDRKVLKSVSHAAAWGLASLCLVKQQITPAGVESNTIESSPFRAGLFAAAPAPYTTDKGSYFEPLSGAAKIPATALKTFGQIFDQAAPTTAIMGLPNGPMCFAGKLADARGPHGTYVQRECSSHQALAAGLVNLKMGRLDHFFVYGFADTNEYFYKKSLAEFTSINANVMQPVTGITGGYSAIVSKEPHGPKNQTIAHINHVGHLSKSTRFDKPHNVIIVSSLNSDSMNFIQDQFNNSLIIDFYSIYPYLAEMSGVVEILHAEQLARNGVIASDSSGLIICGTPAGQMTFLDFNLTREVLC